MNAIVLITTPVLLTGGTELQTLALARVLVDSGYAVTVCCYYEYDDVIVQKFRDAGASVHLMGYDRKDGLWYLAKGLITLFKARKPDVVHVQYLAPGLVPVIAARLAGIETVFATVHQPGSTYGAREKIFIRAALMLSTAFFCNSKAVEESWFGDSSVCNPESPSPGRHCTIYNAVDAEQIMSAVRSADREGLKRSLGITDKKVIGFVGRLRWEKGLDILIDAFPHILRSHPDVVLVVVGDGPDRVKLRKLTEDLKLGDKVKWLGQKAPEEVFQLYGIMDVVVVPSRFEGFGLAAAEAMAAGLPVVSFGVDGLNEIIEDGETGYLIPAENTAKLAEAVIKLLHNQDQAKIMGEKGKEHIKNIFSIERYNNAIRASYNVISSR